jgi:hypothetical protein
MQMTCPKCHGQMRQYERSGITVDQCAECRGIFLDRGELDRLLDAENSWHGASQPQSPPPPTQQQPFQQPPRNQPQYQQPGRPYRDHDSDEYPVYGQHGSGHKKKRRGFLEELFD